MILKRRLALYGPGPHGLIALTRQKKVVLPPKAGMTVHSLAVSPVCAATTLLNLESVAT